MSEAEGNLATNVYYEVTAKALDAQMGQIDQLDTKVSTAYAAATSVLAVFAALVALAALPKSGHVHIAVLICFGAACALYVVVSIFLLLAYRVGYWAYGPKMSTVKEHSEHYPAIGVQAWLANVYAGSIQENDDKIDVKSRWFSFASMCWPLSRSCWFWQWQFPCSSLSLFASASTLANPAIIFLAHFWLFRSICLGCRLSLRLS
jgi:hypothetical protein